MIKLEEICGYLPYGLTGKHIEYTREGIEGSIVHVTVMTEDCISFKESVQEYYFEDDEPFCEFYPLLRPLSDLTREIEHNGERFVPIVELCKMIGFNFILNQIEVKRNYIRIYISNEPYLLIDLANLKLTEDQLKKLYSWHFWIGDQSRFGQDIIDINTLN